MLRQSPFHTNTHPGNVFRMLANTERVGAAALGLIYTILTETELDPKLRETVILRAAQRSDAPYAFSQHAAIAASVGVSAAQILSLEDGRMPDDLFNERTRAALAFADQTLDSPRVSDPAFADLRERFPPRQVVELLLTAACFRMMSRFVTILELEHEPPFGVDTLRRARTPSS
jgi:alkylhydroperoxidase family enzyme